MSSTNPRQFERDSAVRLLAARYPLLVQDISAFAASVPLLGGEAAGGALRRVRQGSNEFLMDCARPAAVIELLEGVDAKPGVVQVFGGAGEFLRFLGREGALACVDQPGWTPLVLMPLQQAGHVRAWLAGAHPRDWPWFFLNGSSGRAAGVGGTVMVELGKQMGAIVADRCGQFGKRLAERYAGRPGAAEIVREGRRPLRVLTVAASSSVYQRFCARDIAEGLEANGCPAKACILGPGPAMFYEVLEEIVGFDPDVLLLNGGHRGGLRGSGVSLPEELCIVSWDQDYCVAAGEDYVSARGPRDRLMVMVRDWREDAELGGMRREEAGHLNLGSNLRIYHPAREAAEAKYDVLFVGNIHPFETYRRIIGFDGLDPAMQKIMLHARERLTGWIKSRGENEEFVLPELGPFLRSCIEELGLKHQGDAKQWRFIESYFRYRIAHFVARQLYLESLSEFRLGLFGRGWEAFEKLAPFARPEVENGAALRDLIHASAINLHLHTWTVHHPRLYDTAAAGGFLLVGRVQEEFGLDRVFDAGSEVDSFGSISEMKNKVRHWLKRPEERAAAAAAAAARARRDHSMASRMNEMVGMLAMDAASERTDGVRQAA